MITGTAERERSARFSREHRVTGYEHQAQEIVANVIVDRRVEIGHGHLLPRFQLVPHLLVLAIEHLAPAQQVDSPVLRRGHEPRAGVARDA